MNKRPSPLPFGVAVAQLTWLSLFERILGPGHFPQGLQIPVLSAARQHFLTDLLVSDAGSNSPLGHLLPPTLHYAPYCVPAFGPRSAGRFQGQFERSCGERDAGC
jgi:hypothetical protein